MQQTQVIPFVCQRLSLFLCLLFLTACGGDTLRVVSPKIPTELPYKHTLSLIGEPELVRNFTQKFKTTDLNDVAILVTTPDPDGLQLNLSLVSRTQDIKNGIQQTLSQPGLLSRKSVKPQHTLSYTLRGTDGKMISGGAAKTSGQAVIVYVPRLSSQPFVATQDDIKNLMEIVSNELTPVIQAQPWRARVVAQQGLQHVVIAAGKKSGLTYGTNLQTETLPLATLQVVTLETTPEGQPRASLRLIQGQLPAVGRAVIPAR